jgi:acyl-CoA synthetase (AMP-forming)/AMP-acid ligase II
VHRSETTQLQACAVPKSLLARATTLLEVLQALVDRFPGFECLILLDRDWKEQRASLEAIWGRAKQVQAALLARGLPPGRSVVLILPTGVELVAGYFGVMLAGGIPALLASPSNRLGDIRAYLQWVGRILENAAAHTLYCEEDVAVLFRAEGGALLGDTTLVTPTAVPVSSPPPSSASANPDGTAAIQYSSGATGAPKGVLLTHRAILNNVRAIRELLGLNSETVSVNWIPLYHDMGLIDAFLLPILSGCPTVLIPTMDFMREPALWLWAIHRYRGQMSWAPNFAYSLCAKRIPDQDLDGLDLSCWRIAISAAEPILASTIEEFTRRFADYGFKREAVTPFYGLAENVTAVTGQPVSEPPQIETIDRHDLVTANIARPTEQDGMDSVGVGESLRGCEIEIRDSQAKKLPDRHVGNIWVRSDSLFSGYNRDPQLTQRVLVAGWLNTGDRGYLVDGQLFFVAREKDLILIGGEKYSPQDVEMAINRVPGVREGCAVAFGVMNEERGTEELSAVVETKLRDSEELDALSRAIRLEVTRITGLAIRHLKLVPPGGIEKTTSGKLARGSTRRRYADEFSHGS